MLPFQIKQKHGLSFHLHVVCSGYTLNKSHPIFNFELAFCEAGTRSEWVFSKMIRIHPIMREQNLGNISYVSALPIDSSNIS